MPRPVTTKLLAALFLGASLTLFGQNIPADFEVASVHRMPSHSLEELKRGIGVTFIGPDGTNRFTARNATLELLIYIAYGVEYNQISAEPDWLDTQLYDIAAEVDSTIHLTREQTRPASAAPTRKPLSPEDSPGGRSASRIRSGRREEIA